jgi:hypothetical protein
VEEIPDEPEEEEQLQQKKPKRAAPKDPKPSKSDVANSSATQVQAATTDPYNRCPCVEYQGHGEIGQG